MNRGGLIALLVLLSGCAAVTNPVADGIPVRRVPAELLAASHNDQTIPLNWLGQCPPDTYRLAPGDVLGVHVDGVLGERNQILPSHVGVGLQVAGVRPLPPSLGYPVPVEGNGTIDLPLAGPLPVAGKNLAEVREAIHEVYIRKNRLNPELDRVIVTLLQPRYASVLVLRQEATAFSLNADERVPTSKRGLGFQLDLPGYENDVLHALARSGGLPGLDACNEVIILRGCFRHPPERAALLDSLGGLRADQNPLPALGGGEVVRIPLRSGPGCQGPPFHPEDVVLRTGDVVFLEARDDPYFYTAGLLPPGRHNLPRGRDMDVIEAIAVARGPLVNGACGVIGHHSPRQLTVIRRTPGGGQVPIVVDLQCALRDPTERITVRPDDVLILQ
jgi:protein involved in polysaccharide export with SLBB domain